MSTLARNVGDLTMDELVARGVAIGLAKKHKPAPCCCPGYGFPHRPHSGKCRGPEQAWCTDCRQPCNEYAGEDVEVSEAWGMRRVDRHRYTASNCCDAPIAYRFDEIQ